MGDEALPHDRTLAGQHSKDALREPRLQGQLPQPDRRQRRQFGGLEDDGIARREGRAETPARDGHREVPRNDDRYNPKGLLEGDIEAARDRDLLAEQPLRCRGVIAQDIDDIARLPARIADRMAGIAHLEAREFLGVRLDHIREPAQQQPAIRRAHRPPIGADRNGFRDGGVGFLDPDQVDGGDDLLGRRIDDIVRGSQCRALSLRGSGSPRSIERRRSENFVG